MRDRRALCDRERKGRMMEAVALIELCEQLSRLNVVERPPTRDHVRRTCSDECAGERAPCVDVRRSASATRQDDEPWSKRVVQDVCDRHDPVCQS